MNGKQYSNITVIGTLPYYLPFPEKSFIHVNELGKQEYFLSVSHFNPERPPNGFTGLNIDDRIGTYIRSKIILQFSHDRNNYIEFIDAYYLQKLFKITNNFIDIARYYYNDPTIRPITTFEELIIRKELAHSQEIEESLAYLPGPYGVGIKLAINKDKSMRIAHSMRSGERINPARLLILDAKYHKDMYDFNRAILDMGIALDIHIEWLLNYYSTVFPEYYELVSEKNTIWDYYSTILFSATGHKLEESENLFANLEFIRALRNSVAHEWKPSFNIQSVRKSKYLNIHKKRNMKIIDNKEQTKEVIKFGIEILDFTESLFRIKYENSQ